MENIAIYLLFMVGLLFIIKGGEAFVDSSCYISKITRIPEFIIGATIVSFATALPELFISLIAGFKGNIDFSVSNMIGSVMSNIGLILAISLLVFKKFTNSTQIIEKAITMLISCLFLFACMYNKRFTDLEGMMLIVIGILSMMLTMNNMQNKQEKNVLNLHKIRKAEIIHNIAKFIISAILIFVGAELLVENGIKLAYLLKIPESIVAITIVAIGTSLPELATTITAIRKGKSDISIGNIFGANIIDLTMILPICALFTKEQIIISERMILQDMTTLIALMIIAVVPFLIKKKFTYVQGIALIFVYFIYFSSIFVKL